jgi:hypothetical protein
MASVRDDHGHHFSISLKRKKPSAQEINCTKFPSQQDSIPPLVPSHHDCLLTTISSSQQGSARGRFLSHVHITLHPTLPLKSRSMSTWLHGGNTSKKSLYFSTNIIWWSTRSNWQQATKGSDLDHIISHWGRLAGAIRNLAGNEWRVILQSAWARHIAHQESGLSVSPHCMIGVKETASFTNT